MDSEANDPNDIPDLSDVEDALQPVLDRIERRWEEDYERPRGLLTDTDRQYLWRILTYANPQTGMNRRQDIRKRVQQGLQDLAYLSLISDDDREQIFEQLDEADTSIHNAVSTLIEFVYLGTGQDLTAIEEIVAAGIWNAEAISGTTPTRVPNGPPGSRYQGSPKDVDVEIDVSYAPSPDAVERRLRQGEADQLTPAEIGLLVRAGRLDPHDLERLSNDPMSTPLRRFPGLPALDDVQDELQDQDGQDD